MYNQIWSPLKQEFVKTSSRDGKRALKMYINSFKTGGANKSIQEILANQQQIANANKDELLADTQKQIRDAENKEPQPGAGDGTGSATDLDTQIVTDTSKGKTAATSENKAEDVVEAAVETVSDQNQDASTDLDPGREENQTETSQNTKLTPQERNQLIAYINGVKDKINKLADDPNIVSIRFTIGDQVKQLGEYLNKIQLKEI